MIAFEELKVYILKQAGSAQQELHVQPNILSANFGIEPSDVREILTSMDSSGLVELKKWDDDEKTERRLRDFADSSAFFASPFDAGYVRVSLQLKGRQILEKVA